MVLGSGWLRPLLVWCGYWIDGDGEMSEFSGTPGPWVVDVCGVDARWNIDATSGESVAITNQLACDNDWAIRDANTRLISAAPELLEVLSEIMEALTTCGFDGDVEQRATAAINKALGR
jgi:hypothetical protein